jgi:hypothetical protein
MENVHGIAVSGGSFPAEIWRLVMERTIGLREPKEFAEPKTSPEWQPFQRGKWALTYDPYYVAPATTATQTTATQTTATQTTGTATTPTPAAGPAQTFMR